LRKAVGYSDMTIGSVCMLAVVSNWRSIILASHWTGGHPAS